MPGMLAVKDDGSGIRELNASQSGMGLPIMRYRAGMIGGILEIARRGDRGTIVSCSFPKEG